MSQHLHFLTSESTGRKLIHTNLFLYPKLEFCELVVGSFSVMSLLMDPSGLTHPLQLTKDPSKQCTWWAAGHFYRYRARINE